MMETKITKAQAEVLANAIRDYAQAQADFETWCRRSYCCNGGIPFDGTFDEWVSDRFTFLAKREQPNDTDGFIARAIRRHRESYERLRSGVVNVYTSSHTLRALERRGLIEVIEDGRESCDTVRLLYV